MYSMSRYINVNDYCIHTFGPQYELITVYKKITAQLEQ